VGIKTNQVITNGCTREIWPAANFPVSPCVRLIDQTCILGDTEVSNDF
jgi:hypothetical protein